MSGAPIVCPFCHRESIQSVLLLCKKHFGVGESPKEDGSQYPTAKEVPVHDFCKKNVPRGYYVNK